MSPVESVAGHTVQLAIGAALLENLLGSSCVEDSDGVKTYGVTFERIVAAALSTDDSLALIARMEEGTRT